MAPNARLPCWIERSHCSQVRENDGRERIGAEYQSWRTEMTKPVLIVGAGPVGLTMATELARYRIPVRIVDKSPQRTDKSKALVLWSRTLELLDRGGGSSPFVEAGFKVHAV